VRSTSDTDDSCTGCLRDDASTALLCSRVCLTPCERTALGVLQRLTQCKHSDCISARTPTALQCPHSHCASVQALPLLQCTLALTRVRCVCAAGVLTHTSAEEVFMSEPWTCRAVSSGHLPVDYTHQPFAVYTMALLVTMLQVRRTASPTELSETCHQPSPAA
jgi:hypothetical protein